MVSENKAQEIKTLIFKEKKDYEKAKEAIFDEYRRRVDVNPTIDKKVENVDSITLLHGEKEGFYDKVIMVPSSFLHRIEKSGINYHALTNQEALQCLTPDSLNFLSGKKGGLEYLCKEG
jgi:hypothetical protein